VSRSDSVSEPLPMAEVRASPSNVVPDRVKRIITPQEILAAVAVGGIAFWAPAEDSGLLLRLVASVLSLGGLLLATVGLELLLEYRKAAELPKTNPFEVKTRRLEVPTAPPGGVFCAACEMSKLLGGFPLAINSRVTTKEDGFQVITGSEKLRVIVSAGTAIGWEVGSPMWIAKRDEWIEAVHAAPRCAQVSQVEWQGIAALAPATGPADELFEVGTLVRIDGLATKPELNGKLGVVIKAVNEGGRVGVRPEGQKETILLPLSKIVLVGPFDRTGVSIPCLRSLRAKLDPMLSGLSAAEAINSVIKPLTMSCRSSVARALARLGVQDEAGVPYTAPATVYMCCTNSIGVADLFEIIERYAATQSKVEAVYVWFDLLCADQHSGAADAPLPMLWWQTTFRTTLKAIGSTCIALHPWDSSEVLKTSVTHMQLHLAIVLSDKSLSPIAKKEKDKKEKGNEEKDKEKHTISVSVTAAEAARLDAAMRDDMEAPMKVLDTRVDGWRKGVEAPTEAQRASIDKAIEKAGPNGESGGYEEFGRKLADILHTWLLDRAKVMLDALPRDERDKSTLVDRTAKLLQDFGDLEAAEPLCREQVESRTKALGEHHSDTLEAVNNLALLLHQLGKLDEALPFSQRKLAGCRAILGDRHPDTITAIDTTSQLLSDLGRLGDALPLKRESLAEKRRTLGERHPDTLLSVNNLAVLLNDLGRQMGDLRMLREAEPLKREALAGCREVLGNRHPHTLASVANLADLLMQLAPGDPRALKEAEPLARESLAGTREVLGNGHPETLKSVGMMAALLVEQGHQCPPKSPQRDAKFREAEPLYREAVVGFSKGLGQYHPTPLSYAHEHDRLLLDMGMVKEAESAARELLSGCRAQLGDSHPETLISITHLGAVLRHAGRLNEALPLAKEVQLGWKHLEREAKIPRNTLTATNILAELLHAMKKDTDAEPYCREVLNGFLRAVGPKHPFTISAAENLAGVLRALNKIDEADKVHKQFGMKVPVTGAITEEGDEGEEADGPVSNGHGAAHSHAKIPPLDEIQDVD